MSIWYFAVPFLVLAAVAIFAGLASGIPEAQRDDDLYFTPDRPADQPTSRGILT